MNAVLKLMLCSSAAAFVAVSAYFVLRPQPVAHPLIDDSFYAFSIARNIADGRGITYGGQPTNGFQPLYVFLIAGIYHLVSAGPARDVLAIRLILALHAALVAVSAWLLARLVRARTQDRRLAWVIAAVWLCSPTTFWRGFIGLETILVVLLMLAALHMYFRWFSGPHPPSWPQTTVFGATLGLGILARIDLPVFAAILAVFYLIRERSGRALARVLLAAGMAALVASPWFIYNKSTFGHFMPSSAVATSARGEVRGIDEPVAVRAGKALECFWWSAPFSGFGAITLYARSLRTPAGWSALPALAVLVFALRAHTRRRDALMFGVIFVAYAAVYTRQSVATWFFNRYMFPSTVLITVGFAYLAQQFFSSAPDGHDRTDLPRATGDPPAATPSSHGPARASGALAALLAAYLASNLLFVIYRISGGSDNIASTKVATVERIRSDSLAGPIGAFQSGVLEYFLRDRIVNLDGKTNAAALDALMQGRLDAYIRERKLRYLVDWPDYCDALVRRYPGLRTREAGRVGQDLILEIESPP